MNTIANPYQIVSCGKSKGSLYGYSSALDSKKALLDIDCLMADAMA